MWQTRFHQKWIPDQVRDDIENDIWENDICDDGNLNSNCHCLNSVTV